MAKKPTPEEEKLSFEKQEFVSQLILKELATLADESGKPIPPQERHILRAIAQLAAFNLSPQQIANNVGIPTARVKGILKSVSMQREIQRLQEELYGHDATKLFKRMVPKAANKIYELISDADKDSSKIEAAKVVLDRAFGKPMQEITQTTTLISQVLKKLNTLPISEIEDAQLVPALSEEKTPKSADLSADVAMDPLEQILMDPESKPAS